MIIVYYKNISTGKLIKESYSYPLIFQLKNLLSNDYMGFVDQELNHLFNIIFNALVHRIRMVLSIALFSLMMTRYECFRVAFILQEEICVVSKSLRLYLSLGNIVKWWNVVCYDVNIGKVLWFQILRVIRNFKESTLDVRHFSNTFWHSNPEVSSPWWLEFSSVIQGFHSFV